MTHYPNPGKACASVGCVCNGNEHLRRAKKSKCTVGAYSITAVRAMVARIEKPPISPRDKPDDAAFGADVVVEMVGIRGVCKQWHCSFAVYQSSSITGRNSRCPHREESSHEHNNV